MMNTRSIAAFRLAAVVLCAAGFSSLAAQEPKAFEHIEVYCPAHFGNTYEVFYENEMRDAIAPLKEYGCQWYSEWFDMECCADLATNKLNAFSTVLWQKIRMHYRLAREMGLKTALIITPNWTYYDQCRSEWKVTEGERIIGKQLICPSIPQARQTLLNNYDRLFSDLARDGTALDAVSFFAYDWGGCACEKCRPWIRTFIILARDIYEVGKKYFPELKCNLVGWWWKPEEHQIVADWVDENAPGMIDTCFLHIPYGHTGPADVRLPKGAKRGAFINIGYSRSDQPDDYGQFGPVVAGSRIRTTLNNLREAGADRIICYSEGVCDDLNKAIICGLAGGKYDSFEKIAADYAAKWFGADEETSRQWGEWLVQWENPLDVDTDASGAALAHLLENTPNQSPDNWRLWQWVERQKLYQINREILACGDDWTEERLAMVDQFWAQREKIHRKIWGIGVPVYIFHQEFCKMPWYDSWTARRSAVKSQVNEPDER
ncbi:MAG: hypothetical protein J6S75_00485 [Thermoguttaceae bacterium]|nr:hypothetical protein [Thermoguttaceae bacterium]